MGGAGMTAAVPVPEIVDTVFAPTLPVWDGSAPPTRGTWYGVNDHNGSLKVPVSTRILRGAFTSNVLDKDREVTDWKSIFIGQKTPGGDARITRLLREGTMGFQHANNGKGQPFSATIGEWHAFRLTEKNGREVLELEGAIFKGSETVDYIWEHAIKPHGTKAGLSWGGWPLEKECDSTGVCTITKLDAYEVSWAPVVANPDAQGLSHVGKQTTCPCSDPLPVSAVKSESEVDTMKDEQKAGTTANGEGAPDTTVKALQALEAKFDAVCKAFTERLAALEQTKGGAGPTPAKKTENDEGEGGEKEKPEKEEKKGKAHADESVASEIGHAVLTLRKYGFPVEGLGVPADAKTPQPVAPTAPGVPASPPAQGKAASEANESAGQVFRLDGKVQVA